VTGFWNAILNYTFRRGARYRVVVALQRPSLAPNLEASGSRLLDCRTVFSAPDLRRSDIHHHDATTERVLHSCPPATQTRHVAEGERGQGLRSPNDRHEFERSWLQTAVSVSIPENLAPRVLGTLPKLQSASSRAFFGPNPGGEVQSLAGPPCNPVSRGTHLQPFDLEILPDITSSG